MVIYIYQVENTQDHGDLNRSGREHTGSWLSMYIYQVENTQDHGYLNRSGR